jgi:hypothetical protein
MQMPLEIGLIELWPMDERHRGAIQAALKQAETFCPPGEVWAVSVYEGHGVPSGGVNLTLRGPRAKLLAPTDWAYETAQGGRFVYSKKFVPGQSAPRPNTWGTEIHDAVKRLLACP